MKSKFRMADKIRGTASLATMSGDKHRSVSTVRFIRFKFFMGKLVGLFTNSFFRTVMKGKMQAAIQSGDIESIKSYILTFGASPNLKVDNQSLVEIASEQRQAGVVETLLDYGADANIKDSSGEDLLASAVKRGDFYLVEKLLIGGVKPELIEKIIMDDGIGDDNKVKFLENVFPDLLDYDKCIEYASDSDHEKLLATLLNYDKGARAYLKSHQDKVVFVKPGVKDIIIIRTYDAENGHQSEIIKKVQEGFLELKTGKLYGSIDEYVEARGYDESKILKTPQFKSYDAALQKEIETLQCKDTPCDVQTWKSAYLKGQTKTLARRETAFENSNPLLPEALQKQVDDLRSSDPNAQVPKHE